MATADQALFSAYLLYSREGSPREGTLEELLEQGGATWFHRINPEWDEDLEVGAPGDVTGDGKPDLLISQPFGGRAFQGVTFLVPGSADLGPLIELDTVAAEEDGILRVLGEGTEAFSGISLSPAGDVDADGIGDFVVGSRQHSNQLGEPRFGIVFGREVAGGRVDLGRLREHGILVEGTRVLCEAVGVLQRAGDLDGDGAIDTALAEVPNRGLPDVVGVVHVVFGTRAAKEFARGDANADGTFDLTDAVYTLTHLFLSGPAPACADAADVDDSGHLDVTDAVYLLNYLFLRGPAPEPPFPELGVDETPDVLACAGVR